MAIKGTHGAIALPPDGSGKQVPQSVMQEINYNNGTIDLKTGDVITFSTSTWTATVLEVDGTTSSGEIHTRVEEPVPDPITNVAGEDILVNAVKVAEVANLNGGTYYFQQAVMVGRDMINTVDIDYRGAMTTKFLGGSPIFDAFGQMKISQERSLADYVHAYDELPNLFYDDIVGGATLTYDGDNRAVVMTNTTASGDRVTRTSHEYHTYQAGVGTLIEFTAAMGDTGKTNVTRRGGYYDDENGVFFEMVDTTFNIVLRSSVTGSVVETRIPSTEWNTDRLNGTNGVFNPSGFAVDPSKNNIYWIDLQWLGAGSVRFGMIIDGVRHVCHEIKNANANNGVYMSTGSLPLRFEQINTGVSASTSEFRYFCATVKSESDASPKSSTYSTDTSGSVTSVTPVQLLAARAAQTYKTKDNRITSYPRSFSVFNGGVDPIKVTVTYGGAVSGGSWSVVGSSSTETNTSATSNTGGKQAMTFFIPAGEQKEYEFNALEKNKRGIRRKADITQWVELLVEAELLAAGTGGTVYVAYNWEEVSD